MKKPHVIKYLCLSMVTVALFTACGKSAGVSTSAGPAEETAADATLSAPQSEEELRETIAGLGGSEEALTQKREYYERLLSMDMFTEADYVELAQIYGNQGDWEEQRRMLYRVLRLYPSKEYADQLSAIVLKRDGTDEEASGIADSIKEALEQQDVMGLRALTESEEWILVMQGNIQGIETRTQYKADGNVIQVRSDYPDAEITWQQASGSFFYYKEQESGCILAVTSYTDGAYNGSVSVKYFDSDGNIARSYDGTFSENVCVDQIMVTADGTEYSGKLNSDGTTAEEQYKSVTEQGGVIYAYSSGGNTYLYQENTEIENFKIDCSYLGLPVYEAWE